MNDPSLRASRYYALIDLGLARRWAKLAGVAGLEPGIDGLLSRAEELTDSWIVRGLAFSGQDEDGPSEVEDDAFLGRNIDYRPIAPREPGFVERASRFAKSGLHSNSTGLLILGDAHGLIELAGQFRERMPLAPIHVLTWRPEPALADAYDKIPDVEIVALEPRPAGFVVIDLDSVINWGALDGGLSELLGSILNRVESETGWDLRDGQATMNQHTRDNLSPRVFRMLQHREIETKVVKSEPEASDKHLIGTMLYHLGQGIRRFVLLSSDKGFAQAIDWARENSNEAEFVVIVEREGSPTVNAYAALENVRLFSVKGWFHAQASSPIALAANGQHISPPSLVRPTGPRTPPTRPVAAPAAKPMPTPRPSFARPTPQPSPRPGPTRTAPPGPGGFNRPPVFANALVCKCCGVRQLRIGPNELCFRCGSRLSVPKAPASDRPDIFPSDRQPFQDGPILEVWRDRQVRRIVVLSNQTMVFGQRFDDDFPVSKVGLNDLLDEPNMISRKQFQISERRQGEYILTILGSRPMYRDAEGRVPIGPDEELPLIEGQEIFLNSPGDRGSRLQFVFRTARP